MPLLKDMIDWIATSRRRARRERKSAKAMAERDKRCAKSKLMEAAATHAWERCRRRALEWQRTDTDAIATAPAVNSPWPELPIGDRAFLHRLVTDSLRWLASAEWPRPVISDLGFTHHDEQQVRRFLRRAVEDFEG